MKGFLAIAVLAFLALSETSVGGPQRQADPCDSYGNCISSSISYVRSNPDGSLYPGDGFSILVSVTTGRNTTGYSISWSFDSSEFERTGGAFTVVGNSTGVFTISASVTFVGNGTRPFSSILTTAQAVRVIQLVISLKTELVNVTDPRGHLLRNLDGTFYHNDSMCDSWSAAFGFSKERTDIKINVTSITPPSLLVFNYSADQLGRTGRFCYSVQSGSAYTHYRIGLLARALNWEGVSLALKESDQPFAVVRYDPTFTSYSYMMYRNSSVPSSLQRPWELLVRYEGNAPGYSYAGDKNTKPLNGSRTLEERAYFSDFRFSTLSYQPFVTNGVFDFHVLNTTIGYDWLNSRSSAPLSQSNRIEKYTFNATASSLSPLLAKGFVYQNVTMTGCWQREGACDLRQNYWLVPFLWNGRLNVVSVDANGNSVPTTPISVTIHNPSPLDQWLVSGFVRVFGSDPKALRAFEAELYPTNVTMVVSGRGSLSVVLNQTSLVPPLISVTAGGSSLTGNFTFTPTFVDSTIESIPNAITGTVFPANATIPLWSYNIVQGTLSFLPVSSTISQPTSFLELVNSSGWVAGNSTEPQTPSAFASQGYGFWPMGENLTVYASHQGGGIDHLGTQRLGPDEYQASFYFHPWSGGISSIQLVEGTTVLPTQSLLSANTYPSPTPSGFTGIYSITYPATGEDTKVIFTNVWGATTTVDLGAAVPDNSPLNLIPVTTAAAFGMAFLAWFVISNVLKTRKASPHD